MTGVGVLASRQRAGRSQTDGGKKGKPPPGPTMTKITNLTTGYISFYFRATLEVLPLQRRECGIMNLRINKPHALLVRNNAKNFL